MTTHKELIYDEQISPLMTEIIRICKEHKIANLCSFCLGPDPDNEGEELDCTTVMLSEDFEPDARQLAASREIFKKPDFMAFVIKKG